MVYEAHQRIERTDSRSNSPSLLSQRAAMRCRVGVSGNAQTRPYGPLPDAFAVRYVLPLGYRVKIEASSGRAAPRIPSEEGGRLATKGLVRSPVAFLSFTLAWAFLLNHVSAPALLHRQETIEEGPVPPERHAEVFRRNVVGLVPFGLQLMTLGGKHFRQPFDRIGHEFVSLYHCCSGLVHETDLNLFQRERKSCVSLCANSGRLGSCAALAVPGGEPPDVPLAATKSAVDSRLSPRSARASISCGVTFVPPQVSLQFRPTDLQTRCGN